MGRRLASIVERVGTTCPDCDSKRVLGVPGTPSVYRCFGCGITFNDAQV